MSYNSDLHSENERKDSKNWKTLKCAQCGESIPVFKPENGDVYYCSDCNKKLFG